MKPLRASPDPPGAADLGEDWPSGTALRLEDHLAGAARGSHSAFEEVYRLTSGPVYGLVRRILRDPAQSEEVAQECLLTLWREADRYEPAQGSAMTWVMTIAHRRAVDRIRSEESKARTAERAQATHPVAGHDEVAEEVEARLEGEAVRRCLSTLPAAKRETITLAYYHGLTYREVAQRLDIPLGTAKTRIRDALLNLRDCLAVAT